MALVFKEKDFLPHQWEFLTSKASMKALVAGFGAGKTHAFIANALKCHIFLKSPQTGYSNGWVAYPNFKLADELFVEPFREALDTCKIKYKYNATTKELRTQFGKINIYSFAYPDRMIGSNLTWAGFDEFDVEKKEKCDKIWIKTLARMRGSENFEIFITTTPEGFKKTYEIFVKEANPFKHLIKAKTTDNHHLPKNYVENLFREYDGALVDAYINGEFVNFNGLSAYYGFKRDKHLSDNLYFERGLPLRIHFDFNVDPYIFGISQHRTNRDIRLLKEFVLRGNSDTFDACERIKEYVGDGSNIDAVIYGDASGTFKSTQSVYTDYQIIERVLKPFFRSLKFEVPRSNPSVRDRLTTVNRLFMADAIMISPDAKEHIADYEQVVKNDKGEIDKSDMKRTHASDGHGYYLTREFGILTSGRGRGSIKTL